jgi:hypothetical protein
VPRVKLRNPHKANGKLEEKSRHINSTHFAKIEHRDQKRLRFGAASRFFPLFPSLLSPSLLFAPVVVIPEGDLLL